MLDLDQLLRYAVERRASDVHIKVGSPPFIRIDGRLERTDHEPVSPVETERIAFAIMPKQRAEEFIATSEADFAYSVAGLGRFRANVLRQRGSVGLVHAAGAERDRRLRRARTAAGGARSSPSTRAGSCSSPARPVPARRRRSRAMVDYINATSQRHIVTIEDPIEVLHADKSSIVNQREVGTDTADFHAAMKRVLRQDPDVILVGEMRDSETVRTALAAAETGHLVFSTLHTISATDSINRVVDFFPPHEQKQIRMSLAASLRGIVSQRLVEKRVGGRAPAVEVLVATGRVFDKIVNAEETHEIETIIAEGEFYGMQTFDQSLLDLYGRGRHRAARGDVRLDQPARPPAHDRAVDDGPGCATAAGRGRRFLIAPRSAADAQQLGRDPPRPREYGRGPPAAAGALLRAGLRDPAARRRCCAPRASARTSSAAWCATRSSTATRRATTSTSRPTRARTRSARIVQGWADAVWLQGQRFGTVGGEKGGETFEITTFRADVYHPRAASPR